MQTFKTFLGYFRSSDDKPIIFIFFVVLYCIHFKIKPICLYLPTRGNNPFAYLSKTFTPAYNTPIQCMKISQGSVQ